MRNLSQSLGGIDPRLYHGTLNAIFLPAVIVNEAAASVREEDKLDRMARRWTWPAGAQVGPSARAMTERARLADRLAQLA